MKGSASLLPDQYCLLFGLSEYPRAQEKSVPKPTKDSTVKENKNYPVCPPGGRSIEDFNKNCTACSLCITACPNGVLQPALLQYGIIGNDATGYGLS